MDGDFRAQAPDGVERQVDERGGKKGPRFLLFPYNFTHGPIFFPFAAAKAQNSGGLFHE